MGWITLVKRALLGRPRASGELQHQLLPKWMALPLFSSDPLSSVAYATEEMMIVLALVGSSAFGLVRPLSAGVALLLVSVVVSYRQTVRAYPHGGGAYIVARENLGEIPGLVAASALLTDYVLTVAVSIAAGVAAISSAATALGAYRVELALGFVALIALTNLRGIREAGTVFALPTYAFIVAMLALVGVGVVSCAVGGCPQAPVTPEPAGTATALTTFLILRAFASGATALTGVEAISNGVPAFRYPQSRNAATTLAIMGAIAVTLFLGISYLAVATGAQAYDDMPRTVVAQIALAVFGDGPGFYLVQIVTAAILILAANTSFADFPRLSSVLARDRYMPHQFASRGDRLVFSNGIIALALAAAGLLIAFDADVSRLVQLYVVGVFTAFTLSQTGMVRHHLRLHGPRWRRSAVTNALGAAATGIVLAVVVATKFTHGAWLVIGAVPVTVATMTAVHRHYQQFRLRLQTGVAEPERPRANHVLLLLDRVDEATARAVSYAQAIRPASLRAIAWPAPGDDLRHRWDMLAPEVPLTIVRAGSAEAVHAMRGAVANESARHPGTFTTAVIPETYSRSVLELVREHRAARQLAAGLVRDGDVVVADLTSPTGGPGPYTVEQPAEHHVVVLVSKVDKSTLRALAYARTLHPTTLRALHVNVDPDRASSLLQEWADWGLDTALELIDSPFRHLAEAVSRYVADFRPDGRHTVVTCVLPEFRLPHWYHQLLHAQSALAIKTRLLLQRGVITTSVPLTVPEEPAPDDREQPSRGDRPETVPAG